MAKAEEKRVLEPHERIKWTSGPHCGYWQESVMLDILRYITKDVATISIIYKVIITRYIHFDDQARLMPLLEPKKARRRTMPSSFTHPRPRRISPHTIRQSFWRGVGNRKSGKITPKVDPFPDPPTSLHGQPLGRSVEDDLAPDEQPFKTDEQQPAAQEVFPDTNHTLSRNFAPGSPAHGKARWLTIISILVAVPQTIVTSYVPSWKFDIEQDISNPVRRPLVSC